MHLRLPLYMLGCGCGYELFQVPEWRKNNSPMAFIYVPPKIDFSRFTLGTKNKRANLHVYLFSKNSHISEL